MSILDIEYRDGELWMQSQSSDWKPVPERGVLVSPLPPPEPPSYRLEPEQFAHLPESMSGRQARFFACLSSLVLHINTGGHGVYATAGDLYRDPRVFGEYGEAAPCPTAYGIKASNHKLRLAGDINLLNLDTGQLEHGSEAHRPFAIWWEDLGQRLGFPLKSGIRFGDANHYEWEQGWEWEPLP